MREIKFRAWDKLRNEYLSGGKVLIEVGAGKMPKCGHLYLDMDGKHCEGRIVIEQFTGLKDCNGVEIYEGDVVTGSYSNLSVDYSRSSSVEWGQTSDSDGWSCGATIGWVASNGSSLLDLVDGGECEVIGNIHEQEGEG